MSSTDSILENTPIPGHEEGSFVDPSKMKIKDVCKIIHEQYMSVIDETIEFFKYHDELSVSLPRDKKSYLEKVESNGPQQILYNLTSNFLYCLEAIKDHNSDYFAYQADKIKKKSGKTEKVKISCLIGKTTMKRIVAEASEELTHKIFDMLVQAFIFLCVQEDGALSFRKEYLKYVNDNFEDSTHFSKMKLMIENVDTILDEYNPADYQKTDEEKEAEEAARKAAKGGKGGKSKGKKGKSGSSGDDEGANPFDFFTKSAGDNLVKNLENSKIGQIAKNISSKMTESDFPMLRDPSQLLASLTNPGAENGLGDLIKFVMAEVQTNLETNNISHTDLMGEAQGMMGGLSKLTGIDPTKMMGPGGFGGSEGTGGLEGMDAPDFAQFAGIFEGLGNELKKSLESEGAKDLD